MRNILAASYLLLGLGAFASQAYSSELTSSKTTISDADNFSATARFTTPEQGDLYLAAQLPDGKFYFITESIGFSETPVAFKKNQSFSGDYTLLNLPAKGLGAGTYLLYSLVVNANANPYDSTSWVGGAQGLHVLTFTMQAATSSTDAGKTLYNQFCVSCHGAAYRPASSASGIRQAITRNMGGMGSLSSMTDAELTQIATYIQSAIGIVPPKP
ncbi:MAG: cytochrome c [Thiotrichaceae bacterium]|nr:cytochrome c [Thiotrichaceae bacterium]